MNIGDAARATELAQDVFVRLYRAIGEYRGDSEWALLETIARNVGYNYIRARTTIKRGAVRAESLDDRDSEKEPAAVHVDPVDRLIEDAAYRHRLGDAARTVSHTFSWEHSQDSFAHVLADADLAEVVQQRRVAQRDEVEPAGPAVAAGDGAVLLAELPHLGGEPGLLPEGEQDRFSVPEDDPDRDRDGDGLLPVRHLDGVAPHRPLAGQVMTAA